MPPVNISDLIGPVSSELPFYDFREVLPKALSKGESDAMGIATRWLEKILDRPLRSVRLFVYHGDATTCDAVQHRFPVNDGDTEFSISIFQTQFIILVRVIPGHSITEEFQMANEFARSLFKHNGRLNLTLMNRDTTGAVGGQASDVDPANYDWLDTIVWWSDGSAISYRMLKRTGPGQSAIVSSAFEANRTWFAAFEKPRATA
jgi:hypothetical protein